MPKYGLGNFEYTLEVRDGKATHYFFDPEDSTNTAEVSVTSKDIEDAGIKDPDSRQVAELALSKVSTKLNDKRDARIRKEQTDDLDRRQTEDRRTREAANELAKHSQEPGVTPVKEEKDGTKVYNTGEAPAPAKTDADTKK